MNKQIKILLVEDDAIIALSTSKSLKNNGYNVITVHNGIRSIESVKSDPEIDLILMDINLGSGIDGTVAAKEILALRAVPIIFLTSHSEKDVVEKVKEITRYGYVIKDSGEFVLMESISMALELFSVNQKLKEDIADRIKAEKELKISENRLNTIFLSSPSGICVNTADVGLFVDVNEAFTKITGYNKSEVLGKEPNELGLWFNDEYSRLAEEQLVNSGKISNIEVTFIKKNGDAGFALISSEFIDYNNRQCVLTLINDITENKKNLNALNESRKIIDNTQKAARLDTWTIDLSSNNKTTSSNGEIKWFSNEGGFNFDNILKVTHPDDLELVKNAWESAMKGVSYEIEHRVIIDNEVTWFYVKADVEVDKNNVPYKIIGITLDITERKKAEEENLNSISLLKAALESTADGILVVGIDGKIKSYNHLFAEMWKIPDELMKNNDDNELLSHVLEQLVEPDSFIKKVNMLYRNPELESFDKVYFNDGRVFERYSIPQKINEKIVGRVWSFRDISEKVIYEKALKRSEERTRSIVNAVPDLMFTLSNNGDIKEYHSRNFDELYLPPEEFIGKNIQDILPPEITIPALDKIKKAIETQKLQCFEYVLKINGKENYYEDRIIPSSDTEVLSIIRNITDDKKNSKELLKMERTFTIISLFSEKIFKEGINNSSVDYMLSELGKAFNLSRTYIFRKTEENEKEIIVKQIYEWCDKNIISSAEVLNVEAFSIPKGTKFSSKLEKMLNDGYLHAKASELTDEYESYIMEVQNLKSYIFIPVYINKIWWGIIGFDECKYEREWNKQEIKALGTASKILGGALEKQMAETELADSKQLYYTLVESSPDSVSVTDLYGNLIFSSKKALELFGYSPDENPSGISVFNWVTESSMPKGIERFSKMIKTGIQETETYILKKKDGTEFLAELTASRYCDSENKPRGLIIVTRDITDRISKEQKIAEESMLRKILIDESGDGIVILDSSGKVYEANKKFAQMLGYNDNEVKELFVWDWDSMFDREIIKNKIFKADDKGEHFETLHRRKDGSVFNVEISSNAVVVNGKKLIFCVCRDITQRISVQKKIKESEEQFSKIFRNSPVGISLTRVSDGIIVDANEAFVKIGGYTKSEVIGKTTVELKVYDEETRNKYLEIMKRDGKVINAELSFLKKDGTIASVIFSWEKVELNTEKYILGIVLDITSRKASEKKIKESEELFSKIFHASPIGISINRFSDGAYLDVNDALLNIGGYNKEEVIGKTTLDLKIFDESTRNKYISKLIENGKLNNEEITYKKRDGTFVNVIMSLEIIDVNGEKCILGTAYNVTDRKISEKELIKSLNEKNILLKELQHRVKNNLSVISSLLNLEMENLVDDNSKNIFRNSITRINTLSNIYEQLYSSNELTQIELSNYLNSLIRSLDKTYKLNEKISIDTKIAENSYIDLKRSVLVGLIFNELLSNSLKYSYPGKKSGSIIAGFDINNGKAKLYVKDNGIGMPKDYDIDTGKSLGLKLVKMLTEQLEGELKITSDKGTHTEVTFNI